MRFLAAFGPGLAVMLADTDVGSIVTAGQSGVQWGYRLLGIQFLLMPVLYLMQELAVRLGIFTGRGHGELIRQSFGPVWAWISIAPLVIATVGTLLTEFSGFAGVGELYGVPRSVALGLAATALLLIVLTGSYRRVERIAIAFGLFVLAFFFVAWAARPSLRAMLSGSIDIPYWDADYRYMVAANIGQLIMPWMIFYQQAAIADKRLGPEHYLAARLDTGLGAVITQGVMAAVLIACAATIGRVAAHGSLDTVGQMSHALTPFLGEAIGRVVFSFGVVGGGMVGAIISSLALAWGLGEVAGYRHTLELHPLRAGWFYAAYALCVVGGAVLVSLWPDLVALSLGIQVVNALLLPLVLGLLIALAMQALPHEHRPRGAYLWLILLIACATSAIGVFAGLSGAGLLG
jgi:Mn2+/Fe2+ NRAMP family transporter